MKENRLTQDWLKQVHRESYMWSLCCCNYDEEMAKDVLQNAYLKVLEKKTGFAGNSRRKTWFFSIIKYTAIDEFRKQKKKTAALENSLDRVWVLEESEGKRELGQRVKNILNRLSGQQRQILTLVFYNDLTIEEAAKVLNISLGAARSHYSRAKENFRKLTEHSKINRDE